jgi:cobalt-zinc-cadmium resistance protein CzcA
MDERYRTDAASIGQILVGTERGDRVGLAALADIRMTEGPSTINREWAKRRIVVAANVRGRDLGSFVAEARAAIDRDVTLPPGTSCASGASSRTSSAPRPASRS